MSEQPPNGTDPTSVSAAPEGSRPSPFQRFGHALVLSPKAFQGPFRPADWLVTLLIVVVIQLAMVLWIQDLVLEHAKERTTTQLQSGDSALDTQQSEETWGKVEAGVRAATIAGPIVGVPLACLVAAAVLMLILNFVFGGSVRFAPLWAVACLARAPDAIESILFGVLAKTRGNVDISFGPAAFLPGNGSVLRDVLGVFNIFDLWMLGIQLVGVGVVAALPRGKTRAAVLIAWIAWWIFSIAAAVVGHLFQGRGGT